MAGMTSSEMTQRSARALRYMLERIQQSTVIDLLLIEQNH